MPKHVHKLLSLGLHSMVPIWLPAACKVAVLPARFLSLAPDVIHTAPGSTW